MNELCRTEFISEKKKISDARGDGSDEGVMAHVRMSYGTYMNEPWHTYEYVKVHIRMSHVTQNSLLREKANLMCEGADVMKESWHTYD